MPAWIEATFGTRVHEEVNSLCRSDMGLSLADGLQVALLKVRDRCRDLDDSALAAVFDGGSPLPVNNDSTREPPQPVWPEVRTDTRSDRE